MGFRKVTVGRLLQAASKLTVGEDDTIGELIQQNAKHHANSRPGAVLNLSDALAARIDELAPAEQPKPKAKAKPAAPIIPPAPPVIPPTAPIIPPTDTVPPTDPVPPADPVPAADAQDDEGDSEDDVSAETE